MFQTHWNSIPPLQILYPQQHPVFWPCNIHKDQRILTFYTSYKCLCLILCRFQYLLLHKYLNEGRLNSKQTRHRTQGVPHLDNFNSSSINLMESIRSCKLTDGNTEEHFKNITEHCHSNTHKQCTYTNTYLGLKNSIERLMISSSVIILLSSSATSPRSSFDPLVAF